MRLNPFCSDLKLANQIIAIMAVVNVVLIIILLVAVITLKQALVRVNTYLIPSQITAPIKLSRLHVNSSYLQQMTLGFLNARLDVTPQSVDASHNYLLKFVAAKNYAAIQKILNEEAKDIKEGDISSVFYITNWQVDPDTLTVRVEGDLRWWFGETKMQDQHKTYQLQYSWDGHQLKVLRIAEGKTDKEKS